MNRLLSETVSTNSALCCSSTGPVGWGRYVEGASRGVRKMATKYFYICGGRSGQMSKKSVLLRYEREESNKRKSDGYRLGMSGRPGGIVSE